MDRRGFLKAIGLGAATAPVADKFFGELVDEGVVTEHVDGQIETHGDDGLLHGKVLEHYRKVLREMGLHNEAIDRMAGKWVSMDHRQQEVAAAKREEQRLFEVRVKSYRAVKQIDDMLRRAEGEDDRKRLIKAKLKRLKHTRKPALP